MWWSLQLSVEGTDWRREVGKCGFEETRVPSCVRTLNFTPRTTLGVSFLSLRSFHSNLLALHDHSDEQKT